MKLAIAVAALTMAVLPAHAGEKLTISQCLEINAGLAALDHYDAVIRDGDKDRVVPKQYKLGAVRITIALNMAALRSVVEATEKARRGIIDEITGGKMPDVGSAEFKEADAKFRAVTESLCNITPGRIRVADLKLGDGPDENAIPPSALAGLAPILDQ